MKKPLQKTLEDLIETRSTRREMVKGVLAAGGAMTAMWCQPGNAAGNEPAPVGEAPRGVEAIPDFPHVYDSGEPVSVNTIEVAPGY